MNPGKKNSNLLKNTGIHFLEFALGFLSLAKCHYQPSHDMKVNSLPFFALIALDSWADQDYTMSELADKLSITKQQLSHICLLYTSNCRPPAHGHSRSSLPAPALSRGVLSARARPGQEAGSSCALAAP